MQDLNVRSHEKKRKYLNKGKQNKYFVVCKGEIDVLWRPNNQIQALEVKWSHQIRLDDMKTLKQFDNAKILSKHPVSGEIEGIQTQPVYEFLAEL